jgi:hypothetical protein
MMLRWPPVALPPDGEGARCVPAEWDMSEEGPALMLHRPSRLLFEIYLRRSADAARLSMFDLVACLVHVCDGYQVPAVSSLTVIGHSAIFAYSMLTDVLDLQSECSDNEIPF